MSVSPAATPEMHTLIPAGTRVRYIKLGQRGRYERECLDKRIIRFGFGSESPERFQVCLQGQWDKLKQTLLPETKSKGTATSITNQCRMFFDDDGSALWITFIGDSLWWGFLEPEPPERRPEGEDVIKKVVGGWQSIDANHQPLSIDRLAGSLTKIQGFRGTACEVRDPNRSYVIGRINGEQSPEIGRAIAATENMRTSALELMKLLGPRDFELLVDLVFSTSGWRRRSTVGKTQKTLDFDIELPSTGERAIVQVKSQTTDAELKEFSDRFKDFSTHQRMFYVYHSGAVHTADVDERITVVHPTKLAELVVDAGLVNWLISKVA